MPSAIALSHDEQMERLARDCPEALPYAVIAGDICFDQLVASGPLRASYRRAFGLSNTQKLVVVSSTWGAESLFGAQPDLPQRLAEHLPVDEFRVALALHPNVWFHHSQWRVREWLAGCRRAGVTLLQDMDQWRAAVVAADLTVGDHGSVPFYSTALGHPLLLAAAPVHAVAPDSPIAALLAAAPRLDPSQDLENQVRRAITDHSAQRYSSITALTTSAPGQAAALLRTALYGLLDLPEPALPAEINALPLPAEALAGPDSHLVEVLRTTPHSARIIRFPAERLCTDATPPRGSHLAVGVAEPRQRWLRLADVIVGAEGRETATWIADTLARLPGCLLATAPDAAGGWLLGNRDGTLLHIDVAGHLFASVACQALLDGDDFSSLPGVWQLDAGRDRHRVCVTRVDRER